MELVIIIILSLLLIPLVLFSTELLRLSLGLLFLLFFPGYTLLAAIYPRKDNLNSLMRVMVSFGLSIAIVILLSFILNYWFSLTLYPILTAILIFTLTTAFIALYRRHRIPEEERLKLKPYFKLFNRYGDKWGIALSIVLALIIVVAIGGIANIITDREMTDRYTEFYVVDDGSFIASTLQLKHDIPKTLTLTVRNNEYQTLEYRVKWEAQDGLSVLNNSYAEEELFSLDHDDEWVHDVTIYPIKTGFAQKVSFSLYTEKDEPYRTLTLLIDVIE